MIRNILSAAFFLVTTALNPLRAQEHKEAAELVKFELIKETLNFLCTDHVVSKDTSFRLVCASLDYDCLDQSEVARVVDGIDTWYKRWQATPVSDSLSVVRLKERIFADVVGRAGKGYRKQLPQYSSYLATMNALIENFGAPILDEPNTDTKLTGAEESSIAANHAVLDPETKLNASTSNSDSPAASTWLLYLALGLAALALVCSYLALTRKKEPTLPLTLENTPERVDELTLRLRRLERIVKESQSEEAVANLVSIMESVEKRVAELESKFKS